jgi:hypothetical protein
VGDVNIPNDGNPVGWTVKWVCLILGLLFLGKGTYDKISKSISQKETPSNETKVIEKASQKKEFLRYFFPSIQKGPVRYLLTGLFTIWGPLKLYPGDSYPILSLGIYFLIYLLFFCFIAGSINLIKSHFRKEN